MGSGPRKAGEIVGEVGRAYGMSGEAVREQRGRRRGEESEGSGDALELGEMGPQPARR